MMILSDKLLILMDVGVIANRLGISRDELCLQLGRDWDDLKETIGILRSLGYVNCNNRYDMMSNKTSDIEYWLTPNGRAELDRRKRCAK